MLDDRSVHAAADPIYGVYRRSCDAAARGSHLPVAAVTAGTLPGDSWRRGSCFAATPVAITSRPGAPRRRLPAPALSGTLLRLGAGGCGCCPTRWLSWRVRHRVRAGGAGAGHNSLASSASLPTTTTSQPGVCLAPTCRPKREPAGRGFRLWATSRLPRHAPVGPVANAAPFSVCGASASNTSF